MDISKVGHCCLLIKTAGRTLLTDPGNLSEAQNEIRDIDLVLITHEHADHCHVESLKQVIANNPGVKIVSNSAVGKILATEGIAHEVLEGTAATTVYDVALEACDGKHEEIFEQIGQVQNTGYLIAEQLFYPGDSFTAPGKPVEILALPVAGPWCKMADAIRYALNVKPRFAFPVHDALLREDRVPNMHRMLGKILDERGIPFVSLSAGEQHSF